MVELVGDLGTAYRLGISSGIEFHIPAINKRGVTLCVHTVCHGLAVCCKNVVNCVMSIGSSGKVVSTCIKNIGHCAICVIGSKIALVNLNSNSLGLACLDDTGLAEAYKLNCSLLNLVIDIILSVGRGKVDLNGFLTVNLTVVTNGNGNIVALLTVLICALFNLKAIIVCEVGVGETVAEGEGNLLAILLSVVACITLIHNRVKVSGLVVLITYVDALLVYHVGRSLIGNLTVEVSVLKRKIVVHCRRRKVVVAIGIYEATRGVNLTCKNIGNSVGTCDTKTANPHTCVNVVIIKEINLKCVRGVYKNDDLCTGCCLYLFCISKKLSFIIVKRKIVRSIFYALVAGEGTVIALTANTGECDYESICIAVNRSLYVIGIVSGVDFNDRCLTTESSVLTATTALGCCFLETLSFIAGVPVPKSFVYYEAACFKSLLKIKRLGSVNVTRACTTVCKIYGINRKGRNLYATCKRKRAVVKQESRTL